MECYEFGRIAYNNKNFYYTIRWMNESLKQLEFEQENPTVKEEIVLDHLSYAVGEVIFLN